MGGAGFQSALGTTVKKMAGMTRSYQEHEIAQKELATSTVEAQEDAFDNLAECISYWVMTVDVSRANTRR